MKAYILKGDPKEVDKVLRENRIRISRGVISITPAEPDTALDVSEIGSCDTDAIADTKEVSEVDTKEAPTPTPKKTRAKKSE